MLVLSVCMQAPDPSKTSAALDGAGEATFRFGDVRQELECVQEVGLSGCVRTDDKDPFSQRQVDLSEVPPVFQSEVRVVEIHECSSSPTGRPASMPRASGRPAFEPDSTWPGRRHARLNS